MADHDADGVVLTGQALVYEGFIHFTSEFSVILARGQDGPERSATGDAVTQSEMIFDEFTRAIMAKIVKKCGTRDYWEDWSASIAEIAKNHITRLTALLKDPHTEARRAFEAISDIPTRLICFSDDVDGMRKVPENVPQQKMLRQHMQKPLTSVPDPYGEYDSFGAHNNAMLRRFLDTFGFEYEFISATEFYKSGRFDDTLRLATERYDAIMKIMLASLREERQQTYSCFLPIHPETGRVLYVPMKNVDAVNHTITFDDEDGREWTLPVTGGNVKLQWKPDFGARWAALDVDFEMYGKDHSTNTPIYDGICEVLGGRKPNHMTYELFLDDQGQKISKSKGNGLTIDEWLTYAATESLSYFMYQKPKTAKRMHFDVIPRAVDEYLQFLSGYEKQDWKGRLGNPVWHIHAGKPPAPFAQSSASIRSVFILRENSPRAAAMNFLP